ncbi:transcription factor bHLH162 isoform X2 [Beta vulgaris subsp. vulgaris]|nr:transcription factor bHLH162 isoform X2 [Beta vulgaris subsp. vulgaris]
MDNNSSESSLSKRDSKTMETHTRNQMKNLYFQLNSLISQDASSTRPIPDQIDEATNYIKQLQENVENLRQRRDSLLLGVVEGSQDDNSSSTRASYPSNSPVRIEVTENGRAMEVTLITRLESQSKFTDVMHIFHEENVEVVKASYSVHENTVFHTIHAKMDEAATSDDFARITENLKKFDP